MKGRSPENEFLGGFLMCKDGQIHNGERKCPAPTPPDVVLEDGGNSFVKNLQLMVDLMRRG